MKRFTKQACRENVVASFFPLKILFRSTSTYLALFFTKIDLQTP